MLTQNSCSWSFRSWPRGHLTSYRVPYFLTHYSFLELVDLVVFEDVLSLPMLSALWWPQCLIFKVITMRRAVRFG